MGEVVGSVHDEHQAHVNDGEAQVDEHADQVQGAGGLAATEHLGVPGEAPDDGRRHDRARHDHQRGGDEDDEEVPQLLEAVVRGEVAQGRGAQVRVGQQGVPGLGQDSPRGGNQAVPRPGAHEEGDVDDAVEQPEAGGHPVPGAPQPDLGSAGQGQQGGEVALIVPGGEGPLLEGHLVLGEPDPLGAGLALVLEVEARVRGDDLNPGAEEHAHEEEVDEMGDAQPEREDLSVRALLGDVVGGLGGKGQEGHHRALRTG